MKKFITIALACLLALSMGSMFVGCTPNNNGSGKVKMIDIKLSEESYGVAVAKGNAELLATVNEVLAEKSAEIAELISVYESKDYDAYDAAVDGTVVEGAVAYSDGMSADEYLVMATDYPFAPFEYMVGTGFGGIDVEIGNMIAAKLGKKLAVKYIEFDMICAGVNAGDADIGLAGLTISPARQNTVDFSTPYYSEAYQVLVVKENDTTFDSCKTTEDVVAILNAMKSGTNVGSQNGTTGAKYISGDKDDPDGFGFEGFANLKMKTYATHADAVRDMVNGAVSFCVVDNLVAASIVAQVNAAA